MPLARLDDRAVIGVRGPDARSFLDRIVTCDLDRVGPGGARLGALLTPQGKILADFILQDGGTAEPLLFLDVRRDAAADLAKRLALYRLRAKVEIADVSSDWAVLAGWGDRAAPTGEGNYTVTDPRLSDLGWRALVPSNRLLPPAEPSESYRVHRIALGVPEVGAEVPLGDAFPHEVLMDQLGGVDFDKGCYVGQEVVSRMQHRGTARTRIVSVAVESGVELGAEVTAGERALGRVGGVAGEAALATVRIDRAADALAAGEPILAGGRPMRFKKPAFVRFPYPGEDSR